MKKSLIFLSFFAMFNLLFISCGSMRPERINQRDDLHYKGEEQQTKVYIQSTDIAIASQRLNLGMQQANLEAQKRALQIISTHDDNNTGTKDTNTYEGVILGNYVQYNRIYKFKLIGSTLPPFTIIVQPNSGPQTVRLPIGTYVVTGWESAGASNYYKGSRTIQVTNLKLYNNNYHFGIYNFVGFR